MQNCSLNGFSQHDTNNVAGSNHKSNSTDSTDCADLTSTELTVHSPKEENVEIAHPEGPPFKKRKLLDSERTTSRPSSPPWKSALAEGPTSFIEDGRRKSTRTNAVPFELLPQDKRHTRAARQDYVNKSKLATSSQPSSPASTYTNTDGSGKRLPSSKATTNGSGSQSPVRSNGKTPNARVHQTKQHSSESPRTRAPSATINTLNGSTPHTLNGKTTQKVQNEILKTPESTQFPKRATRTSERQTTEMPRENKTENTSPLKPPRLRFKVKMPSLGINNPSHVLPSRKYSSFKEWLENEGAPEHDNFQSPEAALEEAQIRERVSKAGEPGQPLSEDRCTYYITDPAEEPPQQYSHHDHLVAHALYFKKLLDKEHKHHRNTAKLFAYWCADAWRKRNKMPEDILKEQEEESRQKHKQVFRDLQRQFDLVRGEIDKRRLERWEQERKVEDQLALDKAIKQSTLLFEKRRSDRMGDNADDDQSDEEMSSSLEDATNNESNMSSSESEGDDDGLDDDATLTAEELRLKYAHLTPHNESLNENQNDVSISDFSQSMNDRPSQAGDANATTPSALDDVDPLLLDDSDESTDMDDDMGNSDDEDRSTQDGLDSDSSGDDPGTLGFLSAKEFDVAIHTGNEENQDEDFDAKDDDAYDEDEILLVPNGTAEESRKVSVEPQNDTSAPVVEQSDNIEQWKSPTEKLPSELPNADSSPTGSVSHELQVADNHVNESAKSTTSDRASPIPNSGTRTPVPHLLRGTLREYQHFGLDWLAGLYSNNINGILADEMGLGKTIQTIALLAHLAVEHEVWGPHLVVVPTSVMLNWEMEFKKWCPGFKILTYYGSQEERRQKRRGWMDEDRWHVCITSYQLVLQDQQTFKRKNWHYMILDEAHNIKNFRSQRWQTLLTFKTQARLLLTGTPLQNNLTELWSLLFFLMPTDESDAGIEGFADLRNFSEWFRRPVEHILEHGRETMDDEAKKVVTKLHTVLRPYILRRLKVDVEKQMPAKYEHVVLCRLSKRQRFLYDGFMSRAQTKETLASGNYLSIINCLMQLRKVCNHPDLFETRPITTSFAMPKSAIVQFEIKELLARRRLLNNEPLETLNLDFMNLVPISREDTSRRLVDDSTRIMAYGPLRALRERQYNRTNWNMNFDGSSVQMALASMDNMARKSRMQELERCLYFESKRHGRRPIYGENLINLLTIDFAINPRPPRRNRLSDWLSLQSPTIASLVQSLNERSSIMDSYVRRFACITPAVVAPGVTDAALTPISSRHLTQSQRVPSYDPFHEAQTRLSIAFPDKRLLQYDCGKLQQLDKLLRRLQTDGHRALIFTQMTKMLDILEQFLNIHGHRYLRLDGATKVEQRQILTERFNNDSRILAFILSSRSGGLGINLTGADTVIFYDLDWNPAMDKQCQDRCHRIGQTRDVHIYRFVSEYTIESNILRKANQKRMLDDVVIQEGEFTTNYAQKVDLRDMFDENLQDGHDEASAAMDRVLDTGVGKPPRVFEQAEDKEDIDAAKNAEKELEHADDADFEEGSVPQTPGQPTQGQAGTPVAADSGEHEPSANNASHHGSLGRPEFSSDRTTDNEPEAGHIDDYLLRFMEWNLKDEPLVLPPDKSKKKSKKGQEHRVKRRR